MNRATLTPPASFASALRHRLADAMEAWDATIEGLDDEALAWGPPAGGWSIGQIMQHLVVTLDNYLPRIEDALSRLERDGVRLDPRDFTHRPSLLGRLLLRAVEPNNPSRFPAPKSFNPGTILPRDLRTTFKRRHDRLDHALHRGDGLNLNRGAVATPVFPFPRLNPGDALKVMVLHAARHERQAARVRGVLGQ